MSLGIVATWLAKPSVPAIQQVAGLATVVIVCADLIRFRSRRFAKFYESVLGIFMREEEKVRPSQLNVARCDDERPRLTGCQIRLRSTGWCTTS